MRRKEKEISSRVEIEQVIAACRICHIGLSDGGVPYVIPVCFGYDGTSLFFHSACEGKKIDILRDNNRVCFEMECDVSFVKDDIACKWGLRYRSVIGFGVASILSDSSQKTAALSVIMRTYSKDIFSFSEEALKQTMVYRVDITSLSGKISGYV